MTAPKRIGNQIGHAAASALRIAAASYLGVLLLMAGCQRSYIYYPRRAPEAALTAEAGRQGLLPWRATSGALIGWRSGDSHPDSPRVLVLHGNAGCAADRGYFADAFAARPGNASWRVYLLEYPGYGARPGPPSETTLGAAARAALEALFEEQPDPVLLLGESLGSAVAGRLAAELPSRVAGLLLITPFTSLTEVAAAHYPWLPVRMFMRDRYDSAAALTAYAGPLAVVLAEHDEVVPARFGRALHDGYTGPKRLFVQRGRTHNTLDLRAGAAWWDEAVRFLSAYERGQTPGPVRASVPAQPTGRMR